MEPVFIISYIVLWVILLLNLLLTFALIKRVNSNGVNSTTYVTLKTGEKAPDFTAITLQGDIVSSKDYIGRSLLMLFMSPTCGPCLKALPEYEALYPLAKRADVDVLLVSFGDLEVTRRVLEANNVTVPTIVAPAETNPLKKDFGVSATPTFYFVYPDGLILSGGIPDATDKGWERMKELWQSAVPMASESEDMLMTT